MTQRPQTRSKFSADSFKDTSKTHLCSSDDDTSGGPEDDDKIDMDTPRVAQWIDDEDLGQTDTASLDSKGADDNDHEVEPSRSLQLLEDDLSTLPLGTLRSAQRSLAQARVLGDTESDSEEQSHHDPYTSDDDLPPHPTKLGKGKEKPDQPSRSEETKTRRSNKHAPVEVTSKRPVSRWRVVVDDALPKSRDPRFLHATGRYDPSKFKQQYNFLPELHSSELLTLREHMKRAQKLVANSPSHLRAEREEEVRRLEHAMKRAESTVNLDNREHVESRALQSVKQTEKEKRKQGKAQWWMKRSEKKALLARARLDAIASVGGKRAVKKAVEKKQRKISQKEKRTRPFPQGEGTDGKRRRPVGPVDTARAAKRRKA